MLDHLNPPPARLVAQMRALAATHKLPAEVGDMLASAGMSAKRAEALAPGLEHIATRHGRRDPVKAVESFLAETAGKDLDAEAIKMAAADALIMQDMAGAGPETALRATVGDSWDHGAGLAAKMAEGLAARISPAVKPEKGREFADASLGALAMMHARAAGHRPWSERDAIRISMTVGAAHTSSDFISTVIGASVDLALSRGYEQQAPEIMRASRPVQREDYRLWQMVRTGAAQTLAPIEEDAEFQHTTFKDEGEFGPRPRINGRLFRVSEEAIANDRIDALQNVTNGMIRGAVERVRQGLVEVIVGAGGFGQTMRDGEPIFDAAHGNLATGAAIDVASVGAMVTRMRRQRGVGDEALDIRPRFLIVPPELETAGRQLLAQITANSVASANPYAGAMELLVEPGLTDPGRWYICADPGAADGLAHSWVGSQGPTVETRLGWEVPALELKVRLDIGFGMLDWRSWTMNPGASGD